jgi:hypothetical protein
LERFVSSLVEHLRSLMLLAVCGADTDLVEAPGGLRELMVRQSGRFDAATYVYMISLLEELRRNVRFSACGRALADAAVVRLASASRFSSIESLLARIEGPEGQRGRAAKAPEARAGGAEAGSAARSARGGPEAGGSQASASGPERRASEEGRGGEASQAQVRAALREPLVQKALEIFDGSLVRVRPTGRGG